MGKMSLKSLQNMTEGLFALVSGIKNPTVSTEWGDYYNDTNYDDAAFREKGKLIENITEKFKPRKTVDLGANLGEFSRIFAKHSDIVLSPDIDPVAVNKNYLLVTKNKEQNIYPMVQDLTNPSPGIGWMNEERASFMDRAKCDLAAGLALIHHLCIGNNLPLDKVAAMFRTLSDKAIVEFVPKEDSQVQRLLSSREDIFPDYDLEHSIEAFRKYYSGCEKIPIAGTCRTLLVFS
jgi:ribosomal protein L11 methylase PrmA